MRYKVLDSVCMHKLQNKPIRAGREGRFHPDTALRALLKIFVNCGAIPDFRPLPGQGLSVLGPGRQDTAVRLDISEEG